MKLRAFTVPKNVMIATLSAAVVWVLGSPAHAKLVVSEEISLSSTESPHATMINQGGELTADGWKTVDSTNHMYVQLTNPIKAGEAAALELYATNFDPALNIMEQVTNFFSVFESPIGIPVAATPGAFITLQVKGPRDSVRLGYGCTKGETPASAMKSSYKTSSNEKLSNQGNYGCHIWNAETEYRFKIEFTEKGLNLYRNDELIWGLPLFHRPADMAFVFIGSDKEADSVINQGCFPGVLYKKLVVYRDDGKPDTTPDPLMARDTIRINCGGFNEVEGWHSDMKYALKGRDYHWNGAFSATDVENAAPIDVYRSLRHKNHSFDSKATYQDSVTLFFPVPDAYWSVRLHFIDHLYPTPRAIDVDLNGVKVIDNMDIRTEAGRHLLALVKEFSLNVTGGKGLTIDVYDDTNEPSGDYYVCGIELVKLGPVPAMPKMEKPVMGRAPGATVRYGIDGMLRVAGPAHGSYTLRVIDAAGRCRISRTIDGAAAIAAGLEPGWYMVRLQAKEKVVESTVFIRP